MLGRDLEQLLAPCCERHQAHLLEVVLRGKQARPVVEVYVDAESAVTSDLCSAISRDAEKVLDATEGFPSMYTLIVSSPGIERPLQFRWQYPKHVGRRMLVKVAEAEYRGTLQAVGSDTITLRSDEGEIEIPLNIIEKAVVLAPW